MIIGVMSDSHDHLPNIRKALGLFAGRKVEALVHAGDFCSPFFFRETEELKRLGVRMHAVFGNNDGDRVLLARMGDGFCEFRDGVHAFSLGGRRIVVMHYPDVAESLYRSGDFDLVVYGHNHRLLTQGEGRLLLNPGTCSGYLADRATVALVDTERMEAEILTL
jgi:hypothetical protein